MKIKKAHILAAAESLFNRFGIRKTGVDEIASTARVAKGTIYNYFGNKEGILRELIQSKIHNFEETIQGSFATISDPIEQMKVVIMERLNLFLQNPFIADNSLQLDENNSRQLEQDLDKKEDKYLRRIISEVRQKNNFSGDEMQVINTILFAIKGIEQSIKNGLGAISPDRIEKDIEYLVKLIFQDRSKGA
ncbi:MAG: TetR/AcrR family transcriptional regulator [Spirochaetota bacterium]